VELEPKSEERDWEGAVFTDSDEGSQDTRADRKFRRRVNRAIDALRADVAGLRQEIDRLRNGRPARRDGFLVTLGRWIVRFVGFLLRHALFDVFVALLVWTYLYRRGDDRARLWGRLFSEWIRRKINSRSTAAEIIKNRVSV